MATQRALLSLFSHHPDVPVSLNTPLTYADRLRIRHPGDAQFALGPHADGGSIERWEDETYRKVYQRCLEGEWENTTLGLLVRELWLNKACMMAPELQVFYLLSHIEQN